MYVEENYRYIYIMAFCKLLIFVVCTMTCTVTSARCQDDCVFHLKRENSDFRFDLTRFRGIRTAFLTESDGLVYSINVEPCKIIAGDRRLQESSACGGIRGSKLCLIKNKTNEIDIGSRIKEVKLDVKDQLVMSFEGSAICGPGQKYTSDITFVCSKTATIGDKIIYKSGIGTCKYIIEMVSVTVCPVDDLDMRKFCEIVIPHSLYKFNLNPLRRLTDNYLVENQNRRFEVNICGRLTANNRCGGNITTICDITDVSFPKVYAVGHSKNDQLLYDASSKSLKLIQHQKATKNGKGRRIEFAFKCDENIPPEKTKPEFLKEGQIDKHDTNVAYFEVATATVCVPRMMSCEIFTYVNNFNLKPLHKRVGNMIVTNEKDGGYFHLNVCDYLNQYDEKIPSSCTGGKTSICYVDKSGKGIPVGSTQIGPYIVGNSILLNYTDGVNCKNAVKWSTVVNFTCSDESQLTHDSTNSTSCTHIFQWKTRKACGVLFKRQDQCLVTHPRNSENVYNMTSLKDDSFIVDDYEDDTQFRFSICSPLQTPCNGYLNSSACWSDNGMEKNIGMFTDQVVFDNGRIYMSMTGERCVNNGPNSYTTVRFMCDFSDSKLIDYKKDLRACTFYFVVYTKHACTPPKKINCTVEDELGNIYDLHKLTKHNTNYEIPIGYKKKIILNVCHSVINNAYTMDNNIEGVDCQLSSGVCLVDSNNLLSFEWYKNLGDVNESPRKVGDTIKLEMGNGFYNGNSVSSVIEFICSNQTKGPELVNDKNHIYKFRWLTPLACPVVGRWKQKRELSLEVNSITTNSVLINGLYYSTYVCARNDDNSCLDEYSNGVDQYSSKPSGQQIILTVNEEKRKYTLETNSYFVHVQNKTCEKNSNEVEKIVFHFICGFKQQKPKVVGKKSCNTKVLVIDPKICDEKLECSVNSYDLTSLKGHYVVHHNGIKYLINMCIPGKDGFGGKMELDDGKIYTIGYQTQPPRKSEGNDRVEVVFTDGDYCSLNCSLKIKYSTKIILECDDSVILGKATFVKIENGEVQFLWKTSYVCFNSKSIDFDKNSCAVTATSGLSKDYLNSNVVINMKNILNTTKFHDDSRKNIYVVDFCAASFCANSSTSRKSECFRSMSLKYNEYKNQLFVYFRHIDGFTKVKILIECSRQTENLLDAYKVSLTDNGEIIIITYSDVMCENYSFIPPTLTTTFKTTSHFEYKLSTNFEYNDYNISNLEEPILSNEEAIEESTVKNINTRARHDHGEKAVNSVNKISTTVEKSSSTSFYSGLTLLMVTVLIFLAWIYRWKLLKEVRKLYHSRYL